MRAMGIDIGTTTISAVMLDGNSGELLGSRTVSHGAFKSSEKSFQKIQDADRLLSFARKMAADLIRETGRPDCIGFTGQMHGMLYVDRNGQAVSPLYTWQDKSGEQLLSDGRSAVQILSEKAGAAAAGYGLTTHYYLQMQNEIPAEAVCMTTISDYIAMRFCGKRTPVLAMDMAASWGCFEPQKKCFAVDRLEELGMAVHFLPEIIKSHEIIGCTEGGELPDGIPVMASLGDNQAGFIGSVQDMCDTVLLNIGTGSQISIGTENYYSVQGSVELRPCTENVWLLAGSGLCGGRAYAMLEQFYQQVLAMRAPAVQQAGDSAEALKFPGAAQPGSQSEASKVSGIGQPENLYAAMEDQARKFLEEKGPDEAWKIHTTFAGTRSHPKERGSILGIGTENFTPGAMTAGMLTGILEELYDMYSFMCGMTGHKASRLVGSGNGLRRNPLMRELAQELFGMKLLIPSCQEEAACGAALHSLVSAGLADSLKSVQSKIHYEQENNG